MKFLAYRSLSSIYPKRSLSIVFFGSDAFSVESCKAIRSHPTIASSLDRLEIVTPPDTNSSQPRVPLKSFALDHGVTVHDAPSSRQLMKTWNPEWLNVWKPDLAVVVSFGYFMPHRILNQFKMGAINVHPSLLPQYRGAAPIHHTILNGDAETGISIMELDRKRFDAGKILKQSVYRIPNHEQIIYHDLYNQLAQLGGRDLTDVTLNFGEYQKNATVQDELRVTKASKLTKEVAQVDWSKHTAAELSRIHRAIGYRFPLQSFYKGAPVQLLNPVPCAHPDGLPSDRTTYTPGSLFIDTKEHEYPQLYIKTIDSWLQVPLLKFKGKGAIGIRDFINGYKPDSSRDRFTSTIM